MFVEKGNSCILCGVLMNYLERRQCIICFIFATPSAIPVLTWICGKERKLANLGQKCFPLIPEVYFVFYLNCKFLHSPHNVYSLPKCYSVDLFQHLLWLIYLEIPPGQNENENKWYRWKCPLQARWTNRLRVIASA